MVIRTRRAALRDRTPVTNAPARSTSKTKGQTKGKAKNASVKVSKKRKPTPPLNDVEIEDVPIAEDPRTRTHDETEISQEEFSIGGFSFENSQQSGMGLPGLALGESVILQSTPPPSWRRRKQPTQRAPRQSRLASVRKQPAGLKASSPLPPSSPVPTSPFLSSRPVGQEPEPEYELGLAKEAPSEHLSDDPFGFLSTERKLRAKKGQPKRMNKGKVADSPTPTPGPEPGPEPAYDDDDGIEDLYASEGEAQPSHGYQTRPARQPSPHSQRSSSLTSIHSPHTPSTPNKRNSNKRKLAPSRDSSPEPSAAPTSPSPSKPRVRSKPSAGEMETSTRGRTRKKRRSKEMKEEEEEGYDEEMDPSQIAEHLEALLPKPISKSKKRTKAQAKGTRQSTRKTARRGKAPSPSSDEDESEPSPPRRSTSKRGGRKPASRTGKAKKNKEEDEGDVDLDELEVKSSFSNSSIFLNSNTGLHHRKLAKSGLNTLRTWTTINLQRRTYMSYEVWLLCRDNLFYFISRTSGASLCYALLLISHVLHWTALLPSIHRGTSNHIP